jgi:hypothetical protein
MQERKGARVLGTVHTDRFYHSLLKQGAMATCEHTEKFQDCVTNYCNETVISVVKRG